jgi:hypothetical protein
MKLILCDHSHNLHRIDTLLNTYPKCLNSRLLEFLGNSEYWAVRNRVAEHPDTPIHVLEKLAMDKSYAIRSTVFFNEKLPRDVFKRLFGLKHENDI